MSEAHRTQPEGREFLAKLAEFRNGLPEAERTMMDALVAHAAHAAPVPGTGSQQGPSVGEDAQRIFFAKLETYRDTLPEHQRPLVDAMVVEAGAAEPPEVEAHEITLWSRIGHPLSYNWYFDRCATDLGGQAYGRLESGWLPFTTNRLYTCRKFEGPIGEA